MAYTTINKSSLYQNQIIYTGDGNASRSITGVGFQPDFTWFKSRSGTNWHNLYDAVRGATKALASNEADVEDTRAQGLTAFGSDGFTVGTDSNVNGNTNKLVAWNWKANGAGSTNTDGAINSTVSVSTISGFSIVKWTGTGADTNIGHGLGAVPSMIIFKNLSVDNSFIVWNKSFNARTRVKLETTDAENTSQTEFMNDTLPTSSLIYLGTDADTNGNGSNYIAYCFRDVVGYSKCNYFKGNGLADGQFINTGFKPAFVLMKRADNTSNWSLFDNIRTGSTKGGATIGKANPLELLIHPDLVNGEANIADGGYSIDTVSNGFKLKSSSAAINASGGRYIYMAFGQSIVGNNNIPCTAR